MAYEVSLDWVKQKYGQRFDVIMKDVKQTDDLRALDFDGHEIFYSFSFGDLGEVYQTERPDELLGCLFPRVADSFNHRRMAVVEGGAKGMGVEIGEAFFGQLYQSLGQVHWLSC